MLRHRRQCLSFESKIRVKVRKCKAPGTHGLLSFVTDRIFTVSEIQKYGSSPVSNQFGFPVFSMGSGVDAIWCYAAVCRGRFIQRNVRQLFSLYRQETDSMNFS